MREPPLRKKIFWKYINIHGKVFGYCLSLGSLIFIIRAIVYIFGEKIDAEEYPVYLLPLFIIFLVLGILVIMAKPYYPKKYREWFERNKKSSKQS